MEAAILANGSLNTTGEPYNVRMLNRSDLADILQLQANVEASLTQPEQLQALTPEEFEFILSGNGFMIGTFVEQALIGFRAMLVPSVDDPEHLGTDAGLHAQDFPKLIHSEISVVHPAYRGNGLQTYMGQLVMANVNRERFRYVAATVSPFNNPSLKDKLALGMEIIALKEKYNGKLRYVLFRDLLLDEKPSPSDVKIVDLGDTEAQQHLLETGFRGTSIQASDGTYEITYQRRSEGTSNHERR
ncbi:N-acetyltransferase [Lentibacillus lipolyticus]|nr:N-acetyltransferase [Lentibacillus lipolyticus]